MTPISIRELSKRYGSVLALKGLELDAISGEILGFLGPNGAGKTTTIRILLDLLRPTSGQAFIFGHDCQTQGVKARSLIGYLPGELGIYGHLTGREVLDLLVGLEQCKLRAEYKRELQERLEFSDGDLRRRLREYSAGMKRKLGLIQAFQADPPLLILDEPSESLDPLVQNALYELLRELKGRGTTVFMSSHVVSEVARVCDRVALLRKGELVLLSSVEEICKRGSRRVHVAFEHEVNGTAAMPPGVGVIEQSQFGWTLNVEGPLGPVLEALQGLPVKDLQVAEPRLEEIVMKYYREGPS